MSRNHLILIPPNIKSILRYFDGFNHNYHSMYEFPRLKYFVKFFLYDKRI